MQLFERMNVSIYWEGRHLKNDLQNMSVCVYGTFYFFIKTKAKTDLYFIGQNSASLHVKLWKVAPLGEGMGGWERC